MGVYDPKKQKFFNLPTIVGIICALALAYTGWWYMPHWWKIWRLEGRMRGIAFEGYHQWDNKKLLSKLKGSAAQMGVVPIYDDTFEIERVPYTDAEKNEIKGDKDDEYVNRVLTSRGKAIVIYFDWSTKAKWPLRDKETEIFFSRRIETDLSTVSW